MSGKRAKRERQERSAEDVVLEAARALVRSLLDSGRPVGFVTLEDPTTNEAGAVLVLAAGPEYVEPAVRFVHGLGNYTSTNADELRARGIMPPEGKS